MAFITETIELDIVSAAVAEHVGGKKLEDFLLSFLANEVKQTKSRNSDNKGRKHYVFGQKVKQTHLATKGH